MTKADNGIDLEFNKALPRYEMSDSPTKQVTRSRSWMVTQRADEFSLEELKTKLSRYVWIGQLEKGEGGYEHYQILIENAEPIRFTTLKKLLPTAHLERRGGTVGQAYEYVTKEDTRVSGPFGNGEIDIDNDGGTRNDLERLREQIFQGVPLGEVIVNEPSSARFTKHLERLELELQAKRFGSGVREVSVEYWWGLSGTGKTSGIYAEHGFEDVYRVVDYAHAFDLYAGQPVIVLDEFHSQLSISYMLNLLDIYPLQLPARYANKWAGFTKVYLVSNEPLEQQYQEVQLFKPETFNALLRRISKVRYFDGAAGNEKHTMLPINKTKGGVK